MERRLPSTLGYNVGMVWLQAVPAFVLWLAYIYLMRNSVQAGRQRYARQTRRRRALAMVGSIFAALAVLLVGMLMLSLPILGNEGGLSAMGVAFITVMGLAFIQLEMTALALTLSLALERETATPRPASDTQNGAGIRQGEKS